MDEGVLSYFVSELRDICAQHSAPGNILGKKLKLIN